MSVTARLNYLRIAPRKVRLVADLIRGKGIEEAQATLNFASKRASIPLLKLLNQAIANAKNNFQMDPANLFISKITVDEGPKYKRWRARARGQAYEIQKKTSHVTLILDEVVKGKKKVRKAKPRPAVPKEEVKEKAAKPKKPKFRPEREKVVPRIGKGIRKIFRRKAF